MQTLGSGETEAERFEGLIAKMKPILMSRGAVGAINNVVAPKRQPDALTAGRALPVDGGVALSLA